MKQDTHKEQKGGKTTPLLNSSQNKPQGQSTNYKKTITRPQTLIVKTIKKLHINYLCI